MFPDVDSRFARYVNYTQGYGQMVQLMLNTLSYCSSTRYFLSMNLLLNAINMASSNVALTSNTSVLLLFYFLRNLPVIFSALYSARNMTSDTEDKLINK